MSFKDEFINFLDQSITPYHFVQLARQKLLGAGYTEINEKDNHKEIAVPAKFFLTRENRSIIAVNRKDFTSGVIVGSHIDSPSLKCTKGTTGFSHCAEFQSVHQYGGGTWLTWYDRDLKIAGKAIFEKNGELFSKIIQTEEAVAIVPGIAAHIKSGIKPTHLDKSNLRPLFSYNRQKTEKDTPTLDSIVSDLCECAPENLIDYEIYLVPYQKASFGGINGEFIHSQRLDDLSCAIPSFYSFLESDNTSTGTNVFIGFENEEISSGSHCGARSDLIESALKLAGADDSFLQKSIFISADVAQGYNPNFADFYNEDHKLTIGDGILWAQHQNMTMMTTAPPLSLVQKIAEEAEVPLKPFICKPFTSAGSTIGPHISARYGIMGVDLGVPLLAMHSIRECAAVADILYMKKLIKAIYEHVGDVPLLIKQTA